MKCNSRRLSQLSPCERRQLAKELHAFNDQWLKETCKEMQKEITNNILCLMCVATNESLGLGKTRIQKLLIRLEEILQTCDDREDFWLLCKRDCKKILGDELFYKYFTDNKLEIRSNEEC